MKKENFRLQAHRGDSLNYPENTIPAYEAAVRAGYRILEADFKFTADGECVAFHDRTINRTCRTATGEMIEEPMRIESLTLAQLRELDAGLYRSDKFRGTKIPTLRKVLSFLKTTDVTLKIDSCFEAFTQAQQESFFSILHEADVESQLAFTCDKLPFLAYLAEEFPTAELHYDGSLTDFALGSAAKIAGDRLTVWTCYENKNTSWYKGTKATPALCEKLHRYGRLGIWLLTERDEFRRAVKEFGADAVETDGSIRPQDLTEL